MNILFTCAGRRTYLLKYFKENMSEGDKIVATDMQLSAPALEAADKTNADNIAEAFGTDHAVLQSRSIFY